MSPTSRTSAAKTRSAKRAARPRTRLPNSKDLYVQNVPARVLLTAKTRALTQGKTLRGFVIEALKAHCAKPAETPRTPASAVERAPGTPVEA